MNRSILTVTTEATDRSLLTVQDLRSATGISSGSDAELAELGRRVSASIVRACHVRAGGATPPTLRKETLTETFRLDSPREALILSRRPIVSVTSVTEDDTDVLTTDEYETNDSSGILRRLCSSYPYQPTCWPHCCKITVVYVAGWETVPDDLRLAGSMLAASLSASTGRDPNVKRIYIHGVEEREYWVPPTTDPLVTQEVLDLLGPYINSTIG